MKRVAILTMLVMTSLAYAAGGNVATITGRVTDSEGAAISHARVLVHWDSAGGAVGLTDNVGLTDDLSVFTDGKGQYSANVPPGFYDVFVRSMGFTPLASKVRVKKGESSTYNGKMSADPLVTKELGDKIAAPAK